jgi:DNA polymerase-3 subunit delta
VELNRILLLFSAAESKGRARRAAGRDFGYEGRVTPDEAIAEAKRGDVRPVYLLTGDEPYEIERVLAAVRGMVLSGAMATFNEEKLVAGETSIDRVISAVKVVPMMAKQRLVVVRSLERWEARSGDDGDEADSGGKTSPLDRIAEYAAAPVSSTCLILIGAKIDGRRKLMNAGRKGGFLVACEPLPRGALPGFVTREASARGHAIAGEIADLLAEIAGPELGGVADAIERLSLYVGPHQPITEDAIAACLVRLRQSTVWELVNAVGRRELGAALAALDDVYDARDRGLRLIGLLAWSLRQLIKFEAASRAGASPEEAARRAGAPPFKARELAQQVRRLGAGELERWLLLLGDADLELKGSRRPPRATLEGTIMQMCRGPALAG